MSKRIISSILVVVIIMSTICAAYAMEMGNAKASVNLAFSGNNALCYASVTAAGEYIDAVVELRKGANVIRTWNISGSSYVVLSDTVSNVVSGQPYTLIVYGTTNGTSFPAKSITQMY